MTDFHPGEDKLAVITVGNAVVNSASADGLLVDLDGNGHWDVLLQGINVLGPTELIRPLHTSAAGSAAVVAFARTSAPGPSRPRSSGGAIALVCRFLAKAGLSSVTV